MCLLQGVRLDKRDEVQCLLIGLNFCLQRMPDECYYLENPLSVESARMPVSVQDHIYPYLLVRAVSEYGIVNGGLN